MDVVGAQFIDQHAAATAGEGDHRHLVLVCCVNGGNDVA
jgi:hypothetical protein